MIRDAALKSWKTTLVGCLVAVANTALGLITTGNVDPSNLLISCGLAAIGVLAKDFNITGN